MAYNFATDPLQAFTATINQEALPITLAARFVIRQNGNTNNLWGVQDSSVSSFHVVFFSGGYAFAVRSENSSGFSGQASVNLGLQQNIWLHGAGLFIANASRRAYYNNNTATNTQTVTSVTYDRLFLAGFGQGAIGPRLAEFAMWTAELTADEIASLEQGFKPFRVRPQNLLYYIPLVRDVADFRSGIALTPTDTPTVADHPRVY
jgi:hypothetical protein